MTRRLTISTAFVVIMALAMVVSPVAMAAGGTTGASDTSESTVGVADLDDEDIAVQTQSGADVEIASELETEASGGDTVEVFVRFDAAKSENFAASTGGAQPTSDSETALKQEADLAQAGLRTKAANTDAISVKNEFWITNAMLVEVDTSRVSLDRLATVDGVTELHSNYEVEQVQPEPVQTDSVEPADHGEYTYGLQQVNAPDAWEEFNATGQGVDVAVIDTGIDPDHPEFADYNESNWAAFDFDGNKRNVDPYDNNSHGTHVAGTILGGDESGQHIGVAPDANLYAINVFPDPNGGTTLAAIVAGMQHAVEQDNDLISMSLGGGGYAGVYIDVVQNAQAAGTHVVAASGNDGPNAEGTPGNVYNVTAVGATDSTGAVASFSTGTEINTSEEWGFIAPDSWPDDYVTPDVAAPGVDIRSAVPGGGYGSKRGTSMATPHVTGVMALMLSAENPDPQTLKDTVEETATKPAPDQLSPTVQADAADISVDQYVNLRYDDRADARYGYGIIDAYSAIAALNGSTNKLTANVEDPDGTPITDLARTGDGASVTLGDVTRSEYAADGSVTFDVADEQVDVEAHDAFGYEDNVTTVNVTGDTTMTVVLNRTLGLQIGQAQSAQLNATGETQIAGDIAHLENYTVSLGETADIAPENVTLDLEAGDYNQSDIPLGTTIDVSGQNPNGQTGDFTLNVSLDAQDGDVLELNHTFEGQNESDALTTGPTTLVDDPVDQQPLKISEANLIEETLISDQIRHGPITIENPTDENQTGTAVWNVGPIGDFAIPVDIGPGEEQEIDVGLVSGGEPLPWGDYVNPGTIEQGFTVYDSEFNRVDSKHVETEIVAGSLNGTVTDAETGDPIGGITVTATDGSATLVTTTNSTGYYELAPDSPGNWTVTAESGSYGPAMSTVTIGQNLTPVTHDVEVGSTPKFDLHMQEDEAFALGIPADVKGGTVGDVVETDAAKIWAFDTETDDWTLVNSSYEISALDALVVSTNAETNATITFAGAPGEDGMATPGSTEIDEGWNFVAPAEFGSPSEAFTSSASIESVMGIQDHAESPMLPDGGFQGVETMNTAANVSPFGGYFVFAADDGEMGANTHEGMTMESAYENLGVNSAPIEGTVTSNVTGEPVEGATVSIAGTSISATTDENGGYVIPETPDSLAQDIVVDAAGYESAVVTGASGTTDVAIDDKVYFNVTDLNVSTGTSYQIGDPVELNYTIRNDGTQTAKQIVSSEFGVDVENARINGSTWQLNSTMFELAPGEEVTVTVQDTIGTFVSTEIQHIGVFTADDSETVEITVE